MPYNTTAIPPRKEVTGQAQLPLSRVKKIVAQDQDINICSNNAAFVITLATEMFIQYLASEGLSMTKLERKPRRNIQYKDLVSHQDNLQFLEDIIPKTVPYKQIKAHAAATRANLSSGASASATIAGTKKAGSQDDASGDPHPTASRLTNGKKHKTSRGGASAGAGTGATRNHNSTAAGFVGASGAKIVGDDDVSMDPNEQLQDEIRRANRRGGYNEDADADEDDDDVRMAD